MSTKTCLHSGCSCSVGPDRLYCSLECEEAARNVTDTTRGCDCGHETCLGHAGKRGQEARGAELRESAEAGPADRD